MPAFRTTTWLMTFGIALATPTAHAVPPKKPAPAAKTPKPQPPSDELTARERAAVRGAAVPSEEESEALKELRRFERAAFDANEPPLPVDAENEAQPRRPVGTNTPGLPPGLRGLWGGSNDGDALEPPPTRKKFAPPDSGFLRSLKMPDVPVRWEPSVLRFLDYFKNDPKGHAILSNLLRRMGRYESIFERVLTQHGAPKSLIYLAMMESGFIARATSNKAAGGFWQFMPTVAPAYGLEVNAWVDSRRDFEKATAAAARYLLDLHHRFGSWPLAFAAFHAGYGNILNSIARFNTNDYWELCKHEAGLPFETTTYVPKILAAAIIGHNREAFGFDDVIPDPPITWEEVEVPAGTALATIARAIGTTPEVMSELNPALLRQRTPPDKGAMKVRVPPGTASAWNAAAGTLPPENLVTYVLRFGETLDDVARARGVSVREIKRINGFRDTSELKGGTMILLPQPGPAQAVPPPQVAEQNEPTLVAVPENVDAPRGRERVFYRAREGDTPQLLAEIFGVSLDEVIEWNNLDPDARLHPKMILQMFVKPGFDKAGVFLLDETKLRVVTLGSEEFHALEVARRGKTRLLSTAREGDTLAKVAKRYGVEVADLARINKLTANAELSPGQRIVVYMPTGEPPREVAGRGAPVKRPVTVGPVPTIAKPANKPTAKPITPSVPGRRGSIEAQTVPPTRQGHRPTPTQPARAAMLAHTPRLPALSSVKSLAPKGTGGSTATVTAKSGKPTTSKPATSKPAAAKPAVQTTSKPAAKSGVRR